MSTVDTTQLSEVLESFRETTNQAVEAQDLDTIARLEQHIAELEGYVRELQQAMWADEAVAALERLEQNMPLTETDREVIRTFLVSDAECYINQENDYSKWLNEMKRLAEDIAKRGRIVDRSSIGALRGVLKDARRLLPDIRTYLEEKRRVDRFDLAVGELDQRTRDMVIRIIREQLDSEKR